MKELPKHRRLTVQRVVMLGTREIEDMTDMEAAYLAGIIDGEGSIHSEREPRIEVVVEMASLLPVKMSKKWGGTISTYHPPDGKKRMYRWTLGRRELIRPFLEKIKPYLQVKGEEIDIAIQLLDILDAKSNGWKEEAKRLVEEIRRLKRLEPPYVDLTKLEGVVARRKKD